jgi:single-strand DNA-binding protein
MKDTNFIAMMGRTTREPEQKYTGGGLCILSFSLAVNRSVKRGNQWEDEANFFDCNYFGKGAEAVAKYIGKGTPLFIEGELRQERWEKDGQKRSAVKIMVNNLRLLDFHKDKLGQQADPVAQVAKTFGGDFADDLPF